MHKSFYKLDCEPFDLQPDLMFLWMGEKYKEALSVLRYGILDNKGFLLLTGEAGIGKTIMLRALTESLPPEIVWAILPNPDVPKMEMFNIIGKGFGMGKEYNSKVEFMLDFGTFLQERHQEGKKMLLIVDSAHLLNQENLEELRLLSNIEEADTKLIHIFFSAQPSFGDVLTLSRNSAIRQRLNLSHAIAPLTVQETTAYIEHRLRVAGIENHILTEKAIRSIHHFSGGIPKKINLICQQVLIEGAQQGRKIIDQSAVQECMQKFARSNPNNASHMDFPTAAMHPRDSEEKNFNRRRMLAPGIGALALLTIIACAGYFFWPQLSQNIQHLRQTPAVGAVPPAKNAAASPGLTEQAPPASPSQTLAVKPATETARPQADLPASPAADTPANAIAGTATHPAAPPPTPAPATSATPATPATPAIDSPDDAGAQEEAKAAIVTISPTTGLATVQPATGTIAPNQKPQALPAPAATPSSAGTAGGEQQAARNSDEIIIVPPPEKIPAQAPPAAQALETPKRNDATAQTPVNVTPPASDKPFPHLKAVLPLRANSLSLTNEGNALLADFVGKFKKAGQGKIEVRGYVSSTSNSKENIRLSLRRAEAVQDMLIRAGIKETSIVVHGMGTREPLASNDTEEGREKNRRVELEMIP